jgi:hypothetical protein
MVRSAAALLSVLMSWTAFAYSGPEHIYQSFEDVFTFMSLSELTTKDHEIFQAGYEACFQEKYSEANYQCIVDISELQWLIMKSGHQIESLGANAIFMDKNMEPSEIHAHFADLGITMSKKDVQSVRAYIERLRPCGHRISMKKLTMECVDQALGTFAKPAIKLYYAFKKKASPDFDSLKEFREQLVDFPDVMIGEYADFLVPGTVIEVPGLTPAESFRH